MCALHCRYQSNTTQTVLDTIISVQPKEVGAIGAESREVVVTRQAKEMLNKVPALYDMFQVKERFVSICFYFFFFLNINYFSKRDYNKARSIFFEND